MQVYHGTYTGNGSSGNAITGVGFQPDLVITKRLANGPTQTIIALSSMPVGYAGKLGDWAVETGMVNSLDPDGFTLGASDFTNYNSDTFYFIAVRDNGAGDFKVGMFTGNGSDGNAITGLAFSPAFVLVKQASPGWPYMTFSSATTTNLAFRLNGSTTSNQSDVFASLNANGFTVNYESGGGHFNANGQAHYWAAFKAVAGKVAVQEWEGDDADNRNISLTDTGITPVFALLKGDAETNAVIRLKNHSGDQSSRIVFGETMMDYIQSFGAGTFQVGSANDVNQGAKKFDGIFIADNFSTTSLSTGTGNWPLFI